MPLPEPSVTASGAFRKVSAGVAWVPMVTVAELPSRFNVVASVWPVRLRVSPPEVPVKVADVGSKASVRSEDSTFRRLPAAIKI